MFKPEGVKYYFWIILNVVLIIAGVVLLLSAKALWGYNRSVIPAKTITVSSEGKAVAVPDLAVVNFSVIAEGADPVKLQKENNDKISNAISYLKNNGIDAKDIKTAGYNLNPKYVYNPKTGRSYIDGYTLTQSVEVKIRDFSKVGEILGTLPTMGINNVNGPNFSIDDSDKFLNQAREQAFTKAKAKAAAMAGYAGSRLGRVVTFSESTGGYPIPIYYSAKAELGLGGGPEPAPVPSIEPGSEEVTVQVSVVYEIW